MLKQNYGNKLFAVKDNLKTAEDNITEIIVNFLQLMAIQKLRNFVFKQRFNEITFSQQMAILQLTNLCLSVNKNY